MVKDQQKVENTSLPDLPDDRISQDRSQIKEDKQHKKPRGLHPMPAILRIPCVVLFLAVISIFFTWFIMCRTTKVCIQSAESVATVEAQRIYSYSEKTCGSDAALDFIREKPDLAVYSYLVIFCLLLVVVAITWMPFLSTGVFFCAISVVTFIHMQKYQLRAEPLLPEEFQLADSVGNLIDFVDSNAITRLVWGVILVLIASLLIEIYVRKFTGRDRKKLAWWDYHSIVPRITFSMFSLALLAGVVNPVLQRKNLEWIEGIDFIAWNQTDNYAANGFIVGFLYNLGNTDQQPPENYNEQTILSIAQKYQNIKESDTGRLAWDDEVDNIVIILEETFYDPALLTKYYDHYGGDITPNLHAIFKEYPSGYMYSPVYGGNTANVEFEVQTGLSNFWANTFPYVNSLPKRNSVLSAALFGKDYDFSSTGLHSYSGAMYKRNIVYPKMGYDIFIDENTMSFTEKDGSSGVINDDSVYKEILRIIESSDTPQVIGVATMQNHSPYAQANYPKLEFPLKVSRDEWTTFSIESSFQSLHMSDKYLGDFIDALDDLDERTVVLWFGDHAMGNLDAYAQSEDKTDRDYAHLTPYFIYANFDIKSPYTEKEVAKHNAALGFNFSNIKGVNLPTVTPNCLLNTLYNTLNLEKPSLFYLVDEVCTTMPVLALAYQNGDPLLANSVLSEYDLVNYDILSGNYYWNGY